jgi:hypothetical protein
LANPSNFRRPLTCRDCRTNCRPPNGPFLHQILESLSTFPSTKFVSASMRTKILFKEIRKVYQRLLKWQVRDMTLHIANDPSSDESNTFQMTPQLASPIHFRRLLNSRVQYISDDPSIGEPNTFQTTPRLASPIHFRRLPNWRVQYISDDSSIGESNTFQTTPQLASPIHFRRLLNSRQSSPLQN